MSLREELVRAATDLLDEGGPGNVTLREVGHRTGVSRTAPYLHFPNKTGLLAAIAALELRSLVVRIQALHIPGIRQFEMLRISMDQYVKWAMEHPERFRLVFGSWEEESQELISAADRAIELLVGLVKGSQSEGTLPEADPWILANAIRSFAHGVAVLSQAGHLLGENRQPLEAEGLVDAYLASMPTVASKFAAAVDQRAKQDEGRTGWAEDLGR